MKFHEYQDQHMRHEVQNEKFNRNTIKFDMSTATAKAADERTLAIRTMDRRSPAEIEAASPKLALTAPIKEENMQVAIHDLSKGGQVNTRGYNELMDEYSLHQLIFRKGKLLDETPEFASFRRTFIDKWGPVSFIIMKFESLFKKYEVAHAIVDGRKLVELTQEKLENAPKNDEMFDCIINKDEVGKFIKIP
jgi:hypothetical protein